MALSEIIYFRQTHCTIILRLSKNLREFGTFFENRKRFETKLIEINGCLDTSHRGPEEKWL